MTTETKKILFVCLGNICRSPAAEGIAHHLSQVRAEYGPDHESGMAIEIDSAGTNGYHYGERADPRMRAAASLRGYTLTSRSRRIRQSDFFDFDWIVAMDRDNYRTLASASPPAATAKLCLFSDFAGEPWPSDVPDPYYGGARGFEEVLDMLEAGMPSLIDNLLAGSSASKAS